MYSILKNSYDIQNEELFGGIIGRYYNLSSTVDTGDFAEIMAFFGNKFPDPDAYSAMVGSFVAKKRKERAIIGSAPPKTLSEIEKREVYIQNDMLNLFWTLLGDLRGQKLFAIIYRARCDVAGVELPNHWRKFWDKYKLIIPHPPFVCCDMDAVMDVVKKYMMAKSDARKYTVGWETAGDLALFDTNESMKRRFKRKL